MRESKSSATRSPGEFIIQDAEQGSFSFTNCASRDFANHELVLDCSREAHLMHIPTHTLILMRQSSFKISTCPSTLAASE